MDEFKPLEEGKLPFKILTKKETFTTQIFYQKGYQEGKCALRFYFSGDFYTKYKIALLYLYLKRV